MLFCEVGQVAERAGQEEVLADVAERPLDLALRLCPVGLAGARVEAVVAGQVDHGAVVDAAAPLAVSSPTLAAYPGLHAVVQQTARPPPAPPQCVHAAAPTPHPFTVVPTPPPPTRAHP